MTYKLTIVQQPDYLHGIATGKRSREAVAACLLQIMAACIARDLNRAIIENRLEGPRLPLWDVFDLAAEYATLNDGRFGAIAYVDADATPEFMAFLKDVTGNRGLPFQAFSSAAAAEEWLRSTVAAARSPAPPASI